MRDGLVSADRPVELLAVLGVVDRHLERPLRDPGELGGERDHGSVGGGLDIPGQLVLCRCGDARIRPGRVDQLDGHDLAITGLGQDGAV